MCIFLLIDHADLQNYQDGQEHRISPTCYDSHNRDLENPLQDLSIILKDGHVQVLRAGYFVPWQPPFPPIEFEISGKDYKLCLKGQQNESAEHVEFIKSEHFLVNGNEVKLDIPADIIYLLGTDVDSRNRRIVSSSMEEVFEKIRICSTKDDAAVSIHGETGTGKGYIAKIIHLNSRRKNHRFIKLDCRIFKDEKFHSNEFDAMLFGDNKNNIKGLLQQANKGVFYIDYFDEIPLPFQARLYNAIKTKKGRCVESHQYYPIDVRILVGSEIKLELLKQEKIIQEDFYYYLAGLKINLPSLKERQDDIVGIAQAFLNQINLTKADDEQQQLSCDFKKSLKEFAFFLQGNLDELKSFITACSTNCQDAEIIREHVPEEYFTFGVDEDNPLFKFFINHLTHINYMKKSTEDLAMSLTSTFYTNTNKLIGAIKKDRSLYEKILHDDLQNVDHIRDRKLSILVKSIKSKKTLIQLIEEENYYDDETDFCELGDIRRKLENVIDAIILSSLANTNPDQRPAKLREIGDLLKYNSKGTAVSQRIKSRIASNNDKINKIVEEMKKNGRSEDEISNFKEYINKFKSVTDL